MTSSLPHLFHISTEFSQIFGHVQISVTMWIVYALCSALFAAITAIFAKMGVQQVNPNLAMGIRSMVVVILIWGIVALKGEMKGLAELSKNNILWLLLSGVATGLSWLFYFKALAIGKVGKVAVIDKLSVALTIILAALFLGEAITLKTAIAAALIITGTIVMIW